MGLPVISTCELFNTLVHTFEPIIHHISSSQLDLWDGEVLVFSSSVEAGSLRRRASKLLPIPVPAVKSKTRQLILTTQRLVCLKRQKELDSPSIKSELSLRAQEQGKETEKESRALIIAVELKTEKEFLVLTVSFHPSAISSWA
jgi:3-phosphoinositide dependent protein kinase-1